MTYNKNIDEFFEEYQKKIEKIKEQRNEFLYPITFYFYGEPGSRKTGLVNELFGKELYDKLSFDKNRISWWNGYCGQEVVLLDDFRSKVGWDELMSILTDNKYEVNRKFN